MRINLFCDYNSFALKRYLERNTLYLSRMGNITIRDYPYHQFSALLASNDFSGVEHADFCYVECSIASIFPSQVNHPLFRLESTLTNKLRDGLCKFLTTVSALAKIHKYVVLASFRPVMDYLGQSMCIPGYITNISLSNKLTLDFQGLEGLPRNLVFLNSPPLSINHSSIIYADAEVDLFASEVRSNDLLNLVWSMTSAKIKVIVVDADDVLWGGLAGEVPFPELKLGGVSPEGRLFREVQRCLKSLKEIGFLLALCSKNTEETVKRVFECHPEMILRWNDFVIHKVSWGAKSKAIDEISNELGLGQDSFIFIDDSPQERAEVKVFNPTVANPLEHGKPLEIISLLRSEPRLKCLSLLEEDARRSSTYSNNKLRDSYISTNAVDNRQLHEVLEVVITEVKLEENFDRVIQLINKTNQFNATHVRYGPSDLSQSIEIGKKVRSFRVSDRFGDYGLVFIVGYESTSEKVVVSDFVGSCRAIGRGAEYLIIELLIKDFFEAGIRQVKFDFIKSPRNMPIEIFYRVLGLIDQEGRSLSVPLLVLSDRINIYLRRVREPT